MAFVIGSINSNEPGWSVRLFSSTCQAAAIESPQSIYVDLDEELFDLVKDDGIEENMRNHGCHIVWPKDSRGRIKLKCTCQNLRGRDNWAAVAVKEWKNFTERYEKRDLEVSRPYLHQAEKILNQHTYAQTNKVKVIYLFLITTFLVLKCYGKVYLSKQYGEISEHILTQNINYIGYCEFQSSDCNRQK